MSYDIDIEGSDVEFNITSNVGQVWRDHMPYDHTEGPAQQLGIKGLHGMTGAQALERLEFFWKHLDQAYHDLFNHRGYGFTCLDADKALQAKYDPSNGWGSLMSALIFTGKLMSECAKHPTGIVHVYA